MKDLRLGWALAILGAASGVGCGSSGDDASASVGGPGGDLDASFDIALGDTSVDVSAGDGGATDAPTADGGADDGAASDGGNGIVTLATPPTGDILKMIALNSTTVFFHRRRSTGTLDDIASVPKAGGATVSVTTPPGLSTIAADDSFLYWASSGTIGRAPAAGGTSTTLWTPTTAPQGGPTWSLLVQAGALYWDDTGTIDGNFDDGVIMSLAAGASTANPIATAQTNPLGMAIHGTNVYWATGATIVTKPLAGGTTSVVATNPAGQASISDIVIDDAGIYWTTNGTASGNAQDCMIVHAPITGGTGVAVATNLQDPTGIALDADAVYWTIGATGTVMKALRSGGAPITISSTEHGPGAIAVDADAVYWANWDGIRKLSPK